MRYVMPAKGAESGYRTRKAEQKFDLSSQLIVLVAGRPPILSSTFFDQREHIEKI